MVKIGAELPKLSQNKTGYPFFGPPCRFNIVAPSFHLNGLKVKATRTTETSKNVMAAVVCPCCGALTTYRNRLRVHEFTAGIFVADTGYNLTHEMWII